MLHALCIVLYPVLDMDNLHFSEEFLDFLAQADMDICVDALGFTSRFGAEESRQEFCTDSYGKWRKPVTYGRSVACEAEPVLLTASLIYI